MFYLKYNPHSQLCAPTYEEKNISKFHCPKYNTWLE